MDAVGQTFFNASGDSQAFTTGANSVNGVDNPSAGNAPSSNPYITQVGGTTLTMNGAGSSWGSEVVWNWAVEEDDPGVGSSGGISSYYSIPNWQTKVVNMTSAGGSANFRNIPDVAANADHVYEIYDNGNDREGNFDGIGGTSCAAPLWAGFMALVNQQAAANGGKSVGFINPALYAMAAGPGYASCIHDVTSGNNTWSSSPSLFYAAENYDLCTGLGTMNGTNLINALASPAAQPSILPSVASSGGFTLSWRTVAGFSYQVQFASNLGAANWSNFGPAIAGSGSVATVSDSFTNAQRFYRVIVLP
jgi:subtilase family serine protease